MLENFPQGGAERPADVDSITWRAFQAEKARLSGTESTGLGTSHPEVLEPDYYDSRGMPVFCGKPHKGTAHATTSINGRRVEIVKISSGLL